MRTEPDPRDYCCPEDRTHPVRVLHDEDGSWAPGEEPIVVCCECGCDADSWEDVDVLAGDPQAPARSTWGEFLDANPDLGDEGGDILDALKAGREYVGGGGAQPVFVVRHA